MPTWWASHDLSCDWNWITKIQGIWALRVTPLACCGITLPSALFSGSLYEFEWSFQSGSHLCSLQRIVPQYIKNWPECKHQVFGGASLLQRIKNNIPGPNKNRKPFSSRPFQCYSAIPPADISEKADVQNIDLSLESHQQQVCSEIPQARNDSILLQISAPCAQQPRSSFQPLSYQLQNGVTISCKASQLTPWTSKADRAQQQLWTAGAVGLIWPEELSSQ